MADEDGTDQEVVAGADRAAPGTGNTAQDHARADHAEAGYDMLETSDLRKLEQLCCVLGISYNQKLKEFGLRPGNVVKSRMKVRFLNTISDLEYEKSERFLELRKQARSLILLWKRSHVPVKQAVLETIFTLADAESCDDICAENSLRCSLEDELKTEVGRLENAQKTERREKYERKKRKLKKFMESTHLSASDIGFDPDQQVEDKIISRATSRIKSKIEQVRASILIRKELIFRIETVQNAISNGWPFKAVRVLLEKAKGEARKLQSTSSDLKFDGMDMSVFLTALEEAASSVLDAAAYACLHDSDSIDFVRSTTRSGARFCSVHVTEDADVDHDTNRNLDWNHIDKKRMLNIVYRVKDLAASIESYKCDFKMNLHREVKDPERRRSFAIVGFGPESSSFALKLAVDEDITVFNIGNGFGNIGISCEVNKYCEKIRKSPKCQLTCKPASLKRNSPLIAAAQDCNGYIFELVEGAPALNICHVMLRVSNLDISTSFYEKALGMQLAGKKDLPSFKCTVAEMRYDGVANSTRLQLTFNYGVQKYSKGDTFKEITVGSDNVGKSLEEVEKAISELGGEVLQRPGEANNVAIFEDPDGYRVVLIDNVDFLKEIAVTLESDEST